MVCRGMLATYGLDPEGWGGGSQRWARLSKCLPRILINIQYLIKLQPLKKKKKKHESIQCNFFCIITPDLCSSVGGGEKQEQESRAIVCHVTVICVHGVGPQPCEASSIKQSKQ